MKSFKEISGGEHLIAIQPWNGMMILATADNLYAVFSDGSVELMKFKYEDVNKSRHTQPDS